ncbi:putative uncharacterized protein [Mycolicibacterium canariasense]|uniref:Uncharacterized protein n=1 Tax=Mycolicibacterium canariasense TaxID=228230 RepID=A0A100WIN9_MYCCR|nr:hypothetical protein [Mycolicibacterium canariasense]MCV7213148.1 hypothetical protein [Mycolicibacterium canariasense]ORU98497.1 hypothetical protein AWB94_28560 [Mycolicibacterium canariasense]GAS98890.1 putative uncharacterized protein [Mycolicibacterium canariasense]
MADLFVQYDADQPEGERLAPEVRDEVYRLAPVNVANGGITEDKLGSASVTATKIADGAVGPTKIAANAVGNGQLAGAAVTTPKLAPNAVTPDKTGTGVVTAYDENGDPINLKIVFLSATDYAGITPDPDTLYGTWS